MAEVFEKIKKSYEAKANIDKGKVRKAFADKFSLSERSFNNRINGVVKLKDDEVIYLNKLLNF